MLTSSGCASLDQRLRNAGGVLGATQVELPAAQMPADCHVREPHAPLTVGSEVRSALKLERKALDRANDRIERCVDHAETFFVVKPVPR